MNTKSLIAPLGLITIAFFGCNQASDAAASKTPTTPKEKISYAIGLDIGRSMKQQSLGGNDIDFAKLTKGISDAMSGAKAALSDSQISEVMMAFQASMKARQDSITKIKADSNVKAGQAFLEKNGKEAGVITTASGLQYKVITEGKGPKPDTGSTVTVNYVGTLINGTEFDSSIKRGQPATFPVTGVIPGWTEALLMMPTGSKWKIVLPSAIAYGEQGAGGQIGPNSTLIFEVELISIEKKKK